jgi:tetratricopeptide (TPR) repeat protein
VAVVAVAALCVPIAGRSLIASPLLNIGTTALYQATLREQASREQRSAAAARALPYLRAAISVDPDGIRARTNLALALAATGDRAAAERVADEARARIDRSAPTSQDALYGVGRAYAAAGAWRAAIDTWAEGRDGPQLLRVGRDLSQEQGRDWTIGVQALLAAANVGAPGRAAQDAITTAALAHGESPEQAAQRLDSLVRAGGTVAYLSLLQQAHVYREAGRLDAAQRSLEAALNIHHDEHADLESALLSAARGQWAVAEPRLHWIVEHPILPAQGIPAGDDPRYWLAVSQARRGDLEAAVATARVGLSELPSEQAVLRVPYAQLLGDTLLALGRPSEALAALEDGQRAGPGTSRLTESIVRARTASGQ